MVPAKDGKCYTLITVRKALVTYFMIQNANEVSAFWRCFYGVYTINGSAPPIPLRNEKQTRAGI